MNLLASLLKALKMHVDALKPVFKGDVVRVVRSALRSVHVFLDRACDYGKGRSGDYSGEIFHEDSSGLGHSENLERWAFLAYVHFVQHNHVVPPIFELQPFDTWHDLAAVGRDMEDAERKHEHWVRRIRVGEVVIAALVDADDVIPEV